MYFMLLLKRHLLVRLSIEPTYRLAIGAAPTASCNVLSSARASGMESNKETLEEEDNTRDDQDDDQELSQRTASQLSLSQNSDKSEDEDMPNNVDHSCDVSQTSRPSLNPSKRKLSDDLDEEILPEKRSKSMDNNRIFKQFIIVLRIKMNLI